MSCKLKVETLDIFFIALLMFSELCFYTEYTINIYVGFLATVLIYTLLRITRNTRVVKQFYNSRTIIWLTFFYLFTFIDCYFRGYERINYFRMISCWATLSCIWILAFVGETNRVLEKYSRACLVAAVSGCCYILVKDGASIGQLSRLGASMSGNVNSVGMALSIFSFGILYLFMNSKKKIFILIYSITVACMLLTGSKKVLFSIIISIFLYLKFGGFKFKKTFTTIAIAILIVYLIFNNRYLYGIIGFRIIDFLGGLGLNVVGAGYSYSTLTREELIETAWKLFMQKPLLGWGYGAVAHYSAVGYYAHNNMMELMACYGIFGLVFYYICHLRQAISISRIIQDQSIKTFFFALLINAIITDIGGVTYTAAGAMPYVCFIIIGAYVRKERMITS